jgi:predicted CoA-binding protein
VAILWVPPSDAEIEKILKNSKNVAIVGASDSRERPVYAVSEWLLDHSHFNLYFVNPRITTLFGHRVYRSLAEVPEWIDIVDVFRNVADMPVVLDEAIAIRAKTMWMQLGLLDEMSAHRGVKNGLSVVADRCLKVDYQRFFSGS